MKLMTREERSAWRDYAADLARRGLKAEAAGTREMLARDAADAKRAAR